MTKPAIHLKIRQLKNYTFKKFKLEKETNNRYQENRKIYSIIFAIDKP